MRKSFLAKLYDKAMSCLSRSRARKIPDFKPMDKSSPHFVDFAQINMQQSTVIAALTRYGTIYIISNCRHQADVRKLPATSMHYRASKLSASPFSGDLAVCGPCGLLVYDANAGYQVKVRIDDAECLDAVWSPTGKYLACIIRTDCPASQQAYLI